jgi:hypothetical protein
MCQLTAVVEKQSDVIMNLNKTMKETETRIEKFVDEKVRFYYYLTLFLFATVDVITLIFFTVLIMFIITIFHNSEWRDYKEIREIVFNERKQSEEGGWITAKVGKDAIYLLYDINTSHK